MRKKYLLLLPLLLFVTLLAHSQTGKISGKVLNEKNEPLASVSVKILGAAGGATTDIEGRYTLTVPGNKKYQLEFSAVGYDKKSLEDVTVEAGKVVELDIVLNVTSKNLETVTVSATRSNARKETAASVISFQKNTNTVASVISAESIRRSPDKNTGEVLKRTPGASIQEGKFLVVRGLADRYNQATLNGILLTSTEPDRKTFSFDMIPSAMIDNIIINKAFVPEYPGEWAGGLIQVNTKDIPSKNFFTVQVGSGFNTQTIGKDFLKAKGGKTDWLGFDDGTRELPSSYKTKSQFDLLTPAEKTAIGSQMQNDWSAAVSKAQPNISFQANGGFTGNLLNKKVGGTFGLIYNKGYKFVDILNRYQTIEGTTFSKEFDYNDERYTQEVTLGALGSFSLQLDPMNKISVRSIINLNTNNYYTARTGKNIVNTDDVKGSEATFKQNTFYTVQINGEHSVAEPVKLKWYGAFNILDGYSPDQRRIQYTRTTGTENPYSMLVGNSNAQESGSRVFQSLNDYIYTAGGDLSYGFDLFGQKQTLKGGYMFQVKDRLYDAQLFANSLFRDNPALRLLPADKIFAPENFGNGTDDKFAFDAIKNRNFRYMANTILNAGYLQLDNQFTPELRVVWGVRVENYDQLIGSVKKSDPRHNHSEITDFLPGFNATYKLNNLTNLRLSGSQTVIRPEFREIAPLDLYDFEVNAAIQGNPALKRTKVTNLDLRYELYPRSGEVFSIGTFFKYFKDPIESYLTGTGSAYSYQNPESATSFGVEAEFRKRLDFIEGFKNFTLQANASFIKSKVKDERLKLDRPMQGQSPYLMNFGLMYDLEKYGINATVLYNQIGKRIFLVGDVNVSSGVPEVWEAGRPLLDFQLGKKVLKNKAEIRMNISDILNQTQYFYQNADNNTNLQKEKDAYRYTRKFGTTFGFTFNYTL